MSKPQFEEELLLFADKFKTRREAIELWKTFNTCDVCNSEAQCVDARVYGKLRRVCKSCIDKYCQFPAQSIPLKEALKRHFKAIKDTTCNYLFCRNLNKEIKWIKYIYIVIEFEKETHEFHEIEGVFKDEDYADAMVQDYNRRFLRYSYEYFEEELK